MAEFFLSPEALEQLAENEQGRKVLASQNQIYLDVDRDSLDTLLDQEETTIFEFQNGSDVQIVDAKSDIDNMKQDRSLFYQHPFGIFILNVLPSEAAQIQKETGVLCLSDQELDKILKGETLSWDGLTYRRSIQCEKESQKHNWEEFLSRIKSIPSNCIVINDRNLFTNDVEENALGAENVATLLNQILPKKLISGAYHVLIIYEDKGDLSKLDIEGIASAILSKISRNRLDLRLEIIGCSRNSSIFTNFTHNRLIATNYGIIDAEHKFAAFDNDQKATQDQMIVYKGLFSEGLSSEDESDFPLFTQRLFLKRIKSLILDAESHDRRFVFSVGTEKYQDETGARLLENRLIRHFS